MSEDWVTVQEAEEILGVTEATVRRRVKRGVLERKDEHGRVFVKIVGGGRSDGTAPGDDDTSSGGDGVPSDGDGAAANRELVEVLKIQLEEANKLNSDLVRQADQAQQLAAMQQKAIESLTGQNQLLLEAAEKSRTWWKFW